MMRKAGQNPKVRTVKAKRIESRDPKRNWLAAAEPLLPEESRREMAMIMMARVRRLRPSSPNSQLRPRITQTRIIAVRGARSIEAMGPCSLMMLISIAGSSIRKRLDRSPMIAVMNIDTTAIWLVVRDREERSA